MQVVDDGAAAEMSRAARLIRDLCRTKRVSFAELSRRTGISQQAMQRWFNGLNDVSLESRRLVARALDEPFERFVFDDDAPLPAAAVELQKVVDAYLASSMADDLTDEMRDQLYRSASWVPGRAPLTVREVHAIADVLRLRLNRRVRGERRPDPGEPRARA